MWRCWFFFGVPVSFGGRSWYEGHACLDPGRTIPGFVFPLGCVVPIHLYDPLSFRDLIDGGRKSGESLL